MKGKIFSKEFLEYLELIYQMNTELRPDLNGNPFFGRPLERAKKDWEWKAEMFAQKNKKISFTPN